MGFPKVCSFFRNISLDEKTGCWNWTGARTYGGYGRLWYLGRPEFVHRISAHCYLNFDFASKLHVLHHCDNPACFNPKHLYIGTHAQNMHDISIRGKRKPFCVHGHPNTPEYRVIFGGVSCCRPCYEIRREAQRKQGKRYLRRMAALTPPAASGREEQK